TRCELEPAIVDAFSSGESWIAAVIETGRRILEDSAVNSLDEPFVTEVVKGAGDAVLVRNELRQEGLPSNSVIHRQAWLPLPAIRYVHVQTRFVNVVLVRRALLERAGSPHHKIAHSHSREPTGKHEGTTTVEIGEFSEPAVAGAETERDLMRSAKPAHIVVQGIAGRIPIRTRRNKNAEPGESTGYRQ